MSFSAAFAKLSAYNQNLAFEVQFNAIQNNAIKRANEEIENLHRADKTRDNLAKLEKSRKDIQQRLPELETYIFGVTGNAARLEDVGAALANAGARFLTNGAEKTTLSAEDVEAIQGYVDQAQEGLGELRLIIHPDIAGSSATIQRLRQLSEDLKGLTPVAGDVPAEDDPAPVNDNRALLEKLREAINAANVGYSGALDAREQANELSTNYQRKFVEIEAKSAELTEVSAKKMIEEVDAIKLKYANMLKALSLSFEANKQMSSYLADQLTAPRPASGSVLNMFT